MGCILSKRDSKQLAYVDASYSGGCATPERPATVTDPTMSTNTLIVGGGHVGRLLARRMDERREAVRFVDDSEIAVRRARESRVQAREATVTSPQALNAAGADGVETAIVLAPEDSTNMLVAQLLRCRFDVPRIVVLVNDPRNCDAFEDAAVEPVCAATAITSAAIRSATDSPDTEPDESPVEDRPDEGGFRSDEETDRTFARSFGLDSRRGFGTLGAVPLSASSGNRFGLLKGGSN